MVSFGPAACWHCFERSGHAVSQVVVDGQRCSFHFPQCLLDSHQRELKESRDKQTHWRSTRRINIISSLLLTVCALCILKVPIWFRKATSGKKKERTLGQCNVLFMWCSHVLYSLMLFWVWQIIFFTTAIMSASSHSFGIFICNFVRVKA